MAVRPFNWIWGLGHRPLSGTPTIVHSLSDVFVLLVTSDSLLSQGIGVEDAEAFFDTTSGCESIQACVKLIRMTAGDSLWVPAGSIPLVAALGDKSTASKKEGG